MNNSMHIICPHCGSSLTDEHIDQTANIVTCNICDTVFSPPHLADSESDGYDISLPANVTLHRDGYQLRIIYKPDPQYGNVAYHILWTGLVLVILAPLFITGRWETLEIGGVDIGWIIFPVILFSLFALPGILLLVNDFAKILNVITITVSAKTLSIAHRPIQFPLDKHIDASQIRQIYVRRSTMRQDGSEQILGYRLHMEDSNGKDYKLLGLFPDAEQALYIEREIERFLDIEDEYVAGEYRDS